MDAPLREPCPTCGEPVALEARLCPYCGHGALVELRLDAAVADARLRYQAARALSALGGPFVSVGALQQAMSQPRPRVAGGLTRAQANAGRDVLEAQGLYPRIAAASPPGGGGLKLVGGVALAVAALTLAGWWALRSRGPAAAAAREGSGKGTAAPVAADLPRTELARRALASTVSLRCANSVGAGFFVGEGQVLTNAHVLCSDGAALKVALADGREGTGTALRSDDDVDLALVAVSGLSAPPLPLGDAAALDVGDRVLIVGSPVGMDFTVHEGMVSAMGRVVLGVSYIQLDAKVNPGNSGGPLLDARGRAVGIVSMKRTDAEGIALALPVNYAWAARPPLIDAPAGASAAFDRLLARAQQEDEALAGKMASEELRPALAAVSLTPDRQLLAHILRPSRMPPFSEEFSFKVWSGDAELCAFTASVGDWKPVDAPSEASRSSARVQAWLQKHNLSTQLYIGEAPLHFERCAADQLRPGVELELQGADPSAARVILN